MKKIILIHILAIIFLLISAIMFQNFRLKYESFISDFAWLYGLWSGVIYSFFIRLAR